MPGTPRWRQVVCALGLGLYVAALGFLGGVITERMRFDHRRADVIRRYDEAVARLHGELITIERTAQVERNAQTRVVER